MKIQKFAAFSDGDKGGNPAGVVITEQHPTSAAMQHIAAEVGFSETAFAAPSEQGFRVRYFSPESEVPFCGHATIALGAALALQYGGNRFELQLNNAVIQVDGQQQSDRLFAALQSPPTHSKPLTEEQISAALNLFGYTSEDLDQRIPSAYIHGGADHWAFCLKSREALANMHYSLDAGRDFMNQEGLVTILLVYIENDQLFHTRNPFASGGVYEDPATGAATAGFAGYLRDLNWPHQGAINIVQGEDMGARSLIHAEIPPEIGSSIRISGTVHPLKE